MVTKDIDLKPFQPLDEYQSPSKPTTETLRSLFAKFTKLFRRHGKTPFLAPDRMQAASEELLDLVTKAPDSRWLCDELSLTLEDFMAKPRTIDNVRFFVMPPWNDTDLIRDWGEENNCRLLEPPDRDAILEHGERLLDFPDLKDDEVLVVPELERWYLRHADGLGLVEALLRRIEQSRARVVVSCNTWAWAYLARVLETGRALPRPLTFVAFDGERLQVWLRQLAQDETGRDTIIRFSGTGSRVFPPVDGADDEASTNIDQVNSFFANLAAESLGIPWIARHMWRSCLYHRDDGDDAEEEAARFAALDDPQTLWVSTSNSFDLSQEIDTTTLLVAHSLMLHGPLTLRQLEQLVPITAHVAILNALDSYGLAHRADCGSWSMTPVGYPFVRRKLIAAGLPDDIV